MHQYLGWLPGAADVQPESVDVYGTHDFLAKFIKPDIGRESGDNFDHNSSHADVVEQIVARVSSPSFQDYIQQNIWSKLGAEYDA
jgi:CubicO group peptidase (beta-lactamase class C family)